MEKLSPILEDLQNDLNKNPVVAPVKLVVAPNAVSSEKIVKSVLLANLIRRSIKEN